MGNGISVSEIDGIKTKIASFDLKINGLKMERDQLYAEIEYIRRERLKKIIGMCFRLGDGSVVKILDYDKEEWSKSGGRLWNPYQMRVLRIPADVKFPNDDGWYVPFEDDCLYTRACVFDDPIKEIREEYDEIPSSEFEMRFDEILGLFRIATGMEKR